MVLMTLLSEQCLLKENKNRFEQKLAKYAKEREREPGGMFDWADPIVSVFC